MNDLLQSCLSGDPRALARVISLVEDRAPGSSEIVRQCYTRAGRAKTIGITGSPGVGKSSLIDRLTVSYRQRGLLPAIIAVDPSSAFTGGAILGDRIRMSSLATDPGVFIRSMATRGHLGGLAAATADVVTVLDAASRDPILIETVGVGQDEIDIARLADLTVVVLVPGMGDDVQALKAGIMEIGDIFVINKCDRPGVEKMERSIMALLSLSEHPGDWSPPVIKTVATDGRGIEDLAAQIDVWYERFQDSAQIWHKKRETARQRLVGLLRERLVQRAIETTFPNGTIEDVIDQIARRQTDPYTIADAVTGKFNQG